MAQHPGSTAAAPPPARTGEGPAAPVRAALAANLRRGRLARGWSLRELAALSSMSKALLSQIERAEANPTVEVLVRLADLMDTTCTDLLRQPLLAPEIIRGADIDEPQDTSAVHLLFTGYDLGRLEVYRSRLHPHAQSQVSTHGPGSMEYVMVVEGRVTLFTEGVPHLLEAGDSARFSGQTSHYYLTQESPAVTHSVVAYPRD
ncbi:helix-turn-helix domain-containing protein [Streptomyces sp. NPDC005531]|uniref:helix-turn-helix domain-containing protein n=1 Tax=unclassified Streptomyces TaxID=2593676 RepID=UPI003677DD6F